MNDIPDFTIEHNTKANRFEVNIDGVVAATEYLAVDGNIFFTHTEVPEKLKEKDIGPALVKYGLSFARLKEFKVVPICPFVASYMQNNPQTHDLLSENL